MFLRWDWAPIAGNSSVKENTERKSQTENNEQERYQILSYQTSEHGDRVADSRKEFYKFKYPKVPKEERSTEDHLTVVAEFRIVAKNCNQVEHDSNPQREMRRNFR